MNIDLLLKTLKYENSHIFAEFIFDKFSDSEMLQLRGEIEKSKKSIEIYDLIECRIPQLFWKLRHKNQPYWKQDFRCKSFQEYSENVKIDRENKSLCWNSIDFN